MSVLNSLIYINENGFHYPTYEQLLNLLKEEYRKIYGNDVYLEADSQDGQWLAIQALAFFELAEVAAAIYNSFSPATATADALSRNVKINGIRRKAASYSTVDLTITGSVGTVINSGIAKDVNEQKWLLPDQVIIDKTGEIVVTARAEKIGDVKAEAQSITKIYTPTLGWQGVTNGAPAIVGDKVETDFDLRTRQSLSVAIPSQSVREGLHGALSALANVTNLKIYENDTSKTDKNGIPPHSFCVVILGGNAKEIAQIIQNKKTIGAGTFGNQKQALVDKYGQTSIIQFSRPSVTKIKVKITLQPIENWQNGFRDVIAQKVADYINNLEIGGVLYLTKLFVPANLLNDTNGKTYDLTELKIAKDGENYNTDNIVQAWDAIFECPLENVEIVVLQDVEEER